MSEGGEARSGPAAAPVEPQPPASRPEPEPARPRRRGVKPEMLVGLAALLVSICAVAVSIYEASLERQHARAAAWPHLELTITVSSEFARIAVVNSGLGPAAIEHVDVRFRGKAYGGWQEVLPDLLGRAPDAYNVSSIRGRMLRAGDELTMIELPARALPPDIMARLPEMGMTICYASIFGDHWEVAVPRFVGAGEWRDVPRCPTAPVDGITF